MKLSRYDAPSARAPSSSVSLPARVSAQHQGGGERVARRAVHAGVGAAVDHREQEHQHLAHEGEVRQAGIDVEVGPAHAFEHVVRYAPDDEGHRAGLFFGAPCRAGLEPVALDAHCGDC